MIEAAVAIHLYLAQPGTLVEPIRARYYRKVRRTPKPLPLPPPSPRVEIIPVRVDNTAFEQEWQYRICIDSIATVEELACVW